MFQSQKHIDRIQKDLDKREEKPVLGAKEFERLVENFPQDHALLRDDCYARYANAMRPYFNEESSKWRQWVGGVRARLGNLVRLGRPETPEKPTWMDVSDLDHMFFNEQFIERFLPPRSSIISILNHATEEKNEIVDRLMAEKLGIDPQRMKSLSKIIEEGVEMELADQESKK
jgi:hypothetical protein